MHAHAICTNMNDIRLGMRNIGIKMEISSSAPKGDIGAQWVAPEQTLDIIVTGFAREASICKSVKVQKPWGLPEKERLSRPNLEGALGV